jgi:hypothetical protein
MAVGDGVATGRVAEGVGLAHETSNPTRQNNQKRKNLFDRVLIGIRRRKMSVDEKGEHLRVIGNAAPSLGVLGTCMRSTLVMKKMQLEFKIESAHVARRRWL